MSTKCQYRMTNDTEWKKTFLCRSYLLPKYPIVPHALSFSLFPASFFIRHLHISYNAPYLPPPPHPILHNLCFSSLLGDTAVPREIENNAYVKFWVANKVHYGRCASDVSTQKSLYGGDRWRALGHQVSTFWSQLPNGVIVLLQLIYNS